jgi:hypothetical protein
MKSEKKIFSHSVGYLFILIIVSFAVQKLKFDTIPFFNSCSYFLNNLGSIQKGVTYVYIVKVFLDVFL